MAYPGILLKTNFMKTRPFAAHLSYADTNLTDGQTDITMLMVFYRIFVRALLKLFNKFILWLNNKF
jgi:hypothetical protein